METAESASLIASTMKLLSLIGLLLLVATASALHLEDREGDVDSVVEMLTYSLFMFKF